MDIGKQLPLQNGDSSAKPEQCEGEDNGTHESDVNFHPTSSDANHLAPAESLSSNGTDGRHVTANDLATDKEESNINEKFNQVLRKKILNLISVRILVYLKMAISLATVFKLKTTFKIETDYEVSVPVQPEDVNSATPDLLIEKERDKKVSDDQEVKKNGEKMVGEDQKLRC